MAQFTPCHKSLYYVTTAVFCIESLKIFASLGILAYQSKDICGSWLMVLKVISYNRKETLKLSVPGIIYVVQNNLGYFALTHLDSGTLEITQQVIRIGWITNQLLVEMFNKFNNLGTLF